MKTFYFKNGLILALMLGSFCACSLKEDTLPFVNQETYYKNEAQCKTVVNSCYIELHSIYSSDLSLITETTTDVLYNTNTTVDAHLEVTPSKPQYGATVWKRGYRGVELCNDAIACIYKKCSYCRVPCLEGNVLLYLDK